MQPLRIKIDPGSRTTGIALVNDQNGEVVFAAELSHRGQQIKKSLDGRRGKRQSRRARQTRYRKPRWSNRRRKKGWLPPSQASRIFTILTWVQRIMRWCSIQAISMEAVRFDMQAIEHPEISGVEYQQGTLFGYELCEYLLLKWEHACTYCGKRNVPLQVEHIVPRAKGGSNRASNLCLACEPCNQRKACSRTSRLEDKRNASGRVLARATGSFDISTKQGRVTSVSYRYCHPIHRNDGYSYRQGARHSSLVIHAREECR